MRPTAKQEEVFPQTHRVNAKMARETLDYAEMLHLARMFERWAFNESSLTPDQATNCLLTAVDYEAIATWCGPNWKSSDPLKPVSLLPFIAAAEAKWTGQLSINGIE